MGLQAGHGDVFGIEGNHRAFGPAGTSRTLRARRLSSALPGSFVGHVLAPPDALTTTARPPSHGTGRFRSFPGASH
jgi:hypothetical protein